MLKNKIYSNLAPLSIVLSLTLPLMSTFWGSFYKESIIIAAALILITTQKFTLKINTATIFLLIFLISLLLNFAFTQKFHQSTVIAIASSILLILIISIASDENQIIDKKKIYLAIIVSGLLNFVFQCIQLQYINIENVAIPLIGNRAYGNTSQANHLGTLLVLAIASTAIYFKSNTKNTVIQIALSIIFGVGIYFTASKTAMLSLFIIFLFFICNNSLRLAGIKVTAPAALVIFTLQNLPASREVFTDPGGSGRIDAWLSFYEALKIQPWSGYGFLNNTIAHFSLEDKEFTQIFGHSHNIFVDFFIWFGAPLGVILSFTFLKLIKDSIAFYGEKIEFALILIPIFIHSFLEYPLNYYYFSFIFFIFTGKALEKNSKEIVHSEFLSKILGIFTFCFFSIIFIDYEKITFAYNIQSRNINLNYPIDDQATVNSYLLDEFSAYTNLLKRSSSYSEKDYENLKYFIQKNPIKFNFKKIIQLSKERENKDTIFYQKKMMQFPTQ